MYKYWGKSAGKADRDPSQLFAHAEKPSKSFHWGIEYEGKVVGELWIYLIENDRMAKLAFRVGTLWQGLGIASEVVHAAVDFCFRNTELKRIWTDVDMRNEASIRVLEKCEFLREGLIRQGKMVSSWCDYYILEDWHRIVMKDYSDTTIIGTDSSTAKPLGSRLVCQ